MINFIGELPDVLTDEETNNYLMQAKNGDIVAQHKLIEHNIKLIIYIVSRQFSNISFKDAMIEKNDFIGIGTVGLIKAIDKFDLNKGYKFNTFAAICIKNEILMSLRKSKNSELNDSYEQITDDNLLSSYENQLPADINTEEDYIKKEIAFIIQDSLNILTNKEREIVELYYYGLNGRRYIDREIAEIFNCSRANISKIKRKAVKKIFIYLKEKDVFDGIDSNNSAQIIGRFKTNKNPNQ